MKIFITGATGLIGAHTTLELLNAGHDVRLLVRNPTAAIDYFAQHGHQVDDLVVSDMLNKGAVKEGMQGCEAVVHIAAIVDLDVTRAQKTQSTNLKSIETVVVSACELGIEKILYISSMSVFYDFSLSHISEETPLTDVKDAYSLSKKLCEDRIRALQEQGQPITTTYPCMVFGPNDPKLAESNSAIIKFITSIMPITSSGIQFVDARDIAIAHRLLLEADNAEAHHEERYIVGGHFISWAAFAHLLETAVGKKLRKIPLPGVVLRYLGIAFDACRKLTPIAYPISAEAMNIVTQLPLASSEKLLTKTAMQFRPAQDTVNDTVSWMQNNHKLTSLRILQEISLIIKIGVIYGKQKYWSRNR